MRVAATRASPPTGSPGLATLPAGSPDPVFAAIERHRKALTDFTGTINSVDDVYAKQRGLEITQAHLDAYRTTDDDEWEARDRLLETTPMTLAGLRAALAYVGDFDDAEDLAAYVPALLNSPVFAASGGWAPC